MLFRSTFSSAANQIGQVTGSFTIEKSDAPSEYTGSSITKTNTDLPTYTASPDVPAFTGTCATSVVLLPIDLVNFIAVNKENVNHLSWTTASEINNDYFTIEKSIDGSSWQILSEVPGAGNSNYNITYNEIDENPYEPITYYRLKQTDFDGEYSYSKLVAVRSGATDLTSEFLVYPNPVRKTKSIVVVGEVQNVVLYNLFGQQVLEKEIDNTATSSVIMLQGLNLAKGTYLLQVVLSNGIVRNEKLILAD